MPVRQANAAWKGTLKDGKGNINLESGSFSGSYSFSSRFESGTGTNPEELIAGAHAGCFSMAFSLMLENEGFKANSIETNAKVKIEKVAEGFKITNITLETKGDVPGIDEAKFLEIANKAKTGCPVSQALASVQIDLKANLK